MQDISEPSIAPVSEDRGETATSPPVWRFRWGLLIPVVLLIVAVAWLRLHSRESPKAKSSSAVPVTVAVSTARDFPIAINTIGAAQPWLAVTVRSQVNGPLLGVPVKQGSNVRKGDLIAEIDAAPYRAALLQAQGALVRDQAMLAQARVDLVRYQRLATQDAIAVRTLDLQVAQVKQDEGIVMLDQGAVAAAQVNLTRTRILAPISGRVGVRLVDPGNVVSPNDANGIITIEQLAPIAITFSLHEGDFQRVSAASEQFRRPLSVRALSQETGGLLGTGMLALSDNHVDPATGTVQVKASFANPHSTLWPGQFVNVRLVLETIHQATTVPGTAVNQGPNGPFVFAVDNGRAVARPVSGVRMQDGIALIQSGLAPGTAVVVDGQLILKDGSKVQVHAPSSAAAK